MSGARLLFVPALLLLASGGVLGADDGYREPDPRADRFFVLVLSDGDRAEYEALPEGERVDWRMRYWNRVDPTPTTDENQREMEHQLRVVTAIRQFRDRRDRFAFDDRARAYIRFGKPNRREKLPGEVALHTGLTGPREFWLYDDMILWFEDARLNGYYEAGLRTVFSLIGGRDQNLREDTGWAKDDQLEFEESFDRFLEVNDIEIDPVRARRFTEDGLHRWEETPEINDYDYGGGEEFRFFFDVSLFAGDAGRTDLLLGFLIPLDKVDFETAAGLPTARLQRRAALFDTDYRLVDRRVENLVHVSDPAGGPSRWIVTCDSFHVEPGEYNLALRVLDLRSHNHGILKSAVSARSFGGDEIRVSDILFASVVTRDTRGEGAYVRNGYRIVPRPIRIYAPGEDVTVYFEVYNIRTGREGRGLYEVEYTLFGTKVKRFTSFFGGSSEGKLEPGIGQTFRSRSEGPAASRRITLDTASLPEDRYTLTIDVTDLGGGSSDRATAQFVVKR